MARAKGEGSICQRSDGRWQASIQLDGQRRIVYGRTRSEAVAKLDELRRQADAAGVLPQPGRRTLGELLDAWMETKGPLWKARTLADYQATADRYVRPAMGSVLLNKITPERIARLLASYQRRGQHRTALKVYRLLAQALGLAVRWAWLGANPCGRVDAPRYQPERKELWTPAELAAFCDGTRDTWLWPLWMTAICSGCRLGELTALCWSDVDTARGTLSISKSVQRIHGQVTVSTPKTAAGRRVVTLPTMAVAALLRQWGWQQEQRGRLGERWQAGELVFSSPRGRALSQRTVEHALGRECRRLGVPVMTPHMLRHLSASLLLSRGIPIPDVARRLGHADASITLRVYAHSVAGGDEQAAAALGMALDGERL